MNDESSQQTHAALFNLTTTTAARCYTPALPPTMIDGAVCEVAEEKKRREREETKSNKKPIVGFAGECRCTFSSESIDRPWHTMFLCAMGGCHPYLCVVCHASPKELVEIIDSCSFAVSCRYLHTRGKHERAVTFHRPNAS